MGTVSHQHTRIVVPMLYLLSKISEYLFGFVLLLFIIFIIKNKRVPFWLYLTTFSLFLFNYSTPTLEIQEYVQIEDYSQKVTSLEKLLENDKYLEGLYYENRILEFNDGSIEIISNPLVGYHLKRVLYYNVYF